MYTKVEIKGGQNITIYKYKIFLNFSHWHFIQKFSNYGVFEKMILKHITFPSRYVSFLKAFI